MRHTKFRWPLIVLVLAISSFVLALGLEQLRMEPALCPDTSIPEPGGLRACTYSERFRRDVPYLTLDVFIFLSVCMVLVLMVRHVGKHARHT